MKNKNLIIVGVALLLLLGAGFYFYQKQKSQEFTLPELPSPPTIPVAPSELSPITPTKPTTPTTPTEPTSQHSEVIIRITGNGFEPKEIEITKGTKVTWINEQSNPSWPASDIHPTHEVYPGSSIRKCGTSEQDKIFDACRGLLQGEKWSFIFNEVGKWYYHDHLNPSWTGEIVVK